MLNKLKNFIGRKIFGITLNIDIVNACPLKCPTCPVSLGRRGGGFMAIYTFKKILDKVLSETKVRKIYLYNRSDPGVHPDLDKFVSLSRSYGIPIYLSTVLHKNRCDWGKVVEARPTEIRISFSGWNMEKYQKGSDLNKFLVNLHQLCSLPRYEETQWTMFFHVYKGNEHEVPMARKLAEELKLVFIPINAIYMITEQLVEKNYDEGLETIKMLKEIPEEAIARMIVDTKYCTVQDKQMTIDAEGTVYLCELVYEDRFKIGNFLTTPYKELRRQVMTHPFCTECRIQGAHTYQYCYGDPVKFSDPVGKAYKERMK